jgi:hypothetical protein
MASVHDLAPETSDSIEFSVWVRAELPTARIPAALQFSGGSGLLTAASCGFPDANAVLLELQSTLSRACDIDIDLERTAVLCELLLRRSTGLGYNLDEPQ